MSLWRQLTRGLRVLVHRRAADQDLADEVADYLDQLTTAHMASGLAPADARRAARLELGNTTVVREEVRSHGWENAIGTLAADLRFALRRLRSNPGFTIVAVLTLALGLGAVTAIFSAVNPILFEPLPYPHADRILMISDFGTDGAPVDVTYGTFRELAARSRSFSAMAAVDAWQPALLGTAEPERLTGQRVTAAWFRVLGVSPALGRDFDAADDVPHGPRVAIVSDGLAERRFGDARAAVGAQITLDGDPYTVIGVMPRGFENVLTPSAEVWAPRQYGANASFDGPEWGHHMRLVGRLDAGITTEQATRELQAIAHTPVPEFPRPVWANLGQGVIVHALQADVTADVKPALVASLIAVILVLTIACVNVTNLLLARGAQRRGEFAMRAALGAGRRRLVSQLLTESLLLAALGGLVGLGVAGLGVRALVALSPPGLPRLHAVRLDASVFLFALGMTAFVGLLVGIVPALGASRGDLHAGMQRTSRRTAGGHRLTRNTLVVAEVALALVLLVSAGLLLRSLQRLFAVAPGFDPSHVISMQVEAAGHAYDNDSTRYQFFTQALDAVQRLPGVTAAAFTSQLPLSGDFDSYGVQFESAPSEDRNADYGAFRYMVTPGYFAAMRIPLRRGRLLTDFDRSGTTEAVLINESFARRRFPGQDPIGQRVRMGPESGRGNHPWDVIVGVVGNVKQASLAIGDENDFYVASGQWAWVDNVQSLVVRTRGSATALIPAIKQAIWSVDRNSPIVRVATMESLVAATATQRRFALTLFEAFALAALALAAIGIYGVLAGGVTERTREIGVRAALGASRGDILVLVVRQGMTVAAIGVLIGLGGAVLSTRGLETLLFGVSRLDPVTYAGVIVLLLGVAALACWIPARRAAAVDPIITLRAE
ncbi:MAG TPA: ABC transporter permease [Gemmatimonadaceae bacterium]